MKLILVLLVLLIGALIFVSLRAGEPAAVPLPTAAPPPFWDQPIPEGTKPVEGPAPKIDVVAVRRNSGKQILLEFHITEEHGYMVDGIHVSFWYRYKDADSGEWIDDDKRVNYFVKKRLGFNETLVDSTPLLDIEFRHLGIDLGSTTTENWGVSPIGYSRAMEPAD